MSQTGSKEQMIYRSLAGQIQLGFYDGQFQRTLGGFLRPL